MKRYLLIIPITIALAIFFYPTTSNSNSTGSVGGKTGSPNDGCKLYISVILDVTTRTRSYNYNRYSLNWI